MTRLDPEELRRYARREWGRPERLVRGRRTQQPVERKVQIAIELYEATKTTRPDWPDERTRRADFDAHVRLRALLDKAANVGAR
jgi:hypothetical protein